MELKSFGVRCFYYIFMPYTHQIKKPPEGGFLLHFKFHYF